MVKRENIDSGYPNFQLDTRDSGSRRKSGLFTQSSHTEFALRALRQRSSAPRRSAACVIAGWAARVATYGRTHPRRHARQCYVFETVAAERHPVNNF
jgi:hypothetical protein